MCGGFSGDPPSSLPPYPFRDRPTLFGRICPDTRPLVGEHCKDCVGIMQDVEASVIALEGFDEALRDAVAFGTADRCGEQVRPRARAMSAASLAM